MKLTAVHLELILNLVRRDFHIRYIDSALGVLWSIILPLAQLVVLVFVFTYVIPLEIEAYPAFVFSAILPWTWFVNCIGTSSYIFLSNFDLLRRPEFEPSALIMVSTLSNLLTYIISLPILFGLLFLYSRQISTNIFYLPVLLLIQFVLIIGLSLIAATFNVFYRDVQHIISVILNLIFYMTPVFYSSSQVGESYKIIYMINPMAVLIQSYRSIFMYDEAPEFGALLLTSVIALAVCTLGYIIYNRNRHKMMDLI